MLRGQETEHEHVPAEEQRLGAPHPGQEARQPADQLDPVASGGHRHQRADPERRQHEHQVHEAAEEVGQIAIGRLQSRTRPAAEHQGGHPDRERSHHDLHDVPLHEGLEEVDRDHVEQDVRERRYRAHGFVHRGGQPHPGAGTQERHRPHPRAKRHQVRGDEPGQDLRGQPPERAHAGVGRQPGQQVEADQRNRGQHQEPDEEVADRLEHGGSFAQDGTGDDPRRHAGEDARAGSEPAALPLRRATHARCSRQFQASASASARSSRIP